jgi:hypothetical protein
MVARERSVAALGIAAHEVSHAYQDAEGSRAHRARHSIGEQLAQIAPWSGFVLIGGFWSGVPLLVALSLVFVGGLSMVEADQRPCQRCRGVDRVPQVLRWDSSRVSGEPPDGIAKALDGFHGGAADQRP